MAHTPLFEKLIHSFRVAGESATTGKPVDAILDQQSKDRISRREFLEAGTLAGVALTGMPDAMRRFRVITTPRVVVVGGGLAGLTCAYRLKQAGDRHRLRGLQPARRALLDAARGIRRGADRRARRRADRPGPHRDPPAGAGAGARSSTTCSRPSSTAPSRSTTSTARRTRSPRRPTT